MIPVNRPAAVDDVRMRPRETVGDDAGFGMDKAVVLLACGAMNRFGTLEANEIPPPYGLVGGLVAP